VLRPDINVPQKMQSNQRSIHTQTNGRTFVHNCIGERGR